jgi:phosphatidylinositol-3-phosphatase
MRKSVVAPVAVLAAVAIAALVISTLSAPGVPEASTTSSPSTSVTQTSTGTTTSTSAPVRTTATQGGQIKHVMVLVMENEESSSVLGNKSAPYENLLASEYALAGDYYAVSHPSLPNYLAMIAGTTFGVTTDCLPSECSFPNSTVATLLDSHQLSWREYAESMPANCSQANSPDLLYAPKHDPFVYFEPITGNPGTGSTSAYCDSHVVPIDQLYTDLATGNLPAFSMVTPNICDDAHSCPLSVGDQWLSTFVPRITNSSSFASTALFITYDEGATNQGPSPLSGGKVVCILVSPFAKPGYVSEVQYSHYSLLATAEALLRIGSLGRNDSTAAPMSDLFSSPASLGLP